MGVYKDYVIFWEGSQTSTNQERENSADLIQLTRSCDGEESLSLLCAWHAHVSHAISKCFLAFDWLKFETLPRKCRSHSYLFPFAYDYLASYCKLQSPACEYKRPFHIYLVHGTLSILFCFRNPPHYKVSCKRMSVIQIYES